MDGWNANSPYYWAWMPTQHQQHQQHSFTSIPDMANIQIGMPSYHQQQSFTSPSGHGWESTPMQHLQYPFGFAQNVAIDLATTTTQYFPHTARYVVQPFYRQPTLTGTPASHQIRYGAQYDQLNSQFHVSRSQSASARHATYEHRTPTNRSREQWPVSSMVHALPPRPVLPPRPKRRIEQGNTDSLFPGRPAKRLYDGSRFDSGDMMVQMNENLHKVPALAPEDKQVKSTLPGPDVDFIIVRSPHETVSPTIQDLSIHEQETAQTTMTPENASPATQDLSIYKQEITQPMPLRENVSPTNQDLSVHEQEISITTHTSEKPHSTSQILPDGIARSQGKSSATHQAHTSSQALLPSHQVIQTVFDNVEGFPATYRTQQKREHFLNMFQQENMSAFAAYLPVPELFRPF